MSTADTVANGMTAVTPEAAAELAMRAAEAALPLLPLPAGAVAGAALPDDVPGDWPAVLVAFSGTPAGTCAVVLEPAAADALTQALAAAAPEADPEAATDLAGACAPALQAAHAALGPTAGLAPQVSTGQEVAGVPAAAVVRLDVDGAAAAFVVLTVEAQGAVTPGNGGPPDAADTAKGLDLLRSVPMEVTAEIGRTRMTIQELLSLTPGAVVELDRPVGSPADVLVNGRLFARGEVVVVDEDFAIRVTEIVDGSDTPQGF